MVILVKKLKFLIAWEVEVFTWYYINVIFLLSWRSFTYICWFDKYIPRAIHLFLTLHHHSFSFVNVDFFLFFFSSFKNLSVFHLIPSWPTLRMSTNPWILLKLLGCTASWSQGNRLMYIIHYSYTIKIVILLIVQQCNFPCFFNPFFHWKRPIVNVDSHPKVKYIMSALM
jgi:hypothetical protein